MAEKYTDEENKSFNSELKKLKNRASRLILNDYYDHIHLSELQYSILTQLTNAEKHSDINAYLWNSGAIEETLDFISQRIKQARKEDK